MKKEIYKEIGRFSLVVIGVLLVLSLFASMGQCSVDRHNEKITNRAGGQ